MENESIEKVMKFLRDRKIDDCNILRRLREEKMDISAIQCTPENYLISHFNLPAGDVFALKAFCEKDTRTSKPDRSARVKQLIEDIDLEIAQKGKNGNKGLPKKAIKIVKPCVKDKKKSVFLGWMHANAKGQYVKVRMDKGGGTKKFDLSSSLTKDEIITLAKQKYNPEAKYGDLAYDLMGSDGEPIPPVLMSDGKEYPFTIKNFADLSGYSRIRLYLGTREVDSTSDDDFNSTFVGRKRKKTTLSDPRKSKTSLRGGRKWRGNIGDELFSKEDDDLYKTDFEDVHNDNFIDIDRQEGLKSSHLVGSSAERQTLKGQQDLEYELSALADLEKMASQSKHQKMEADERKRLEHLRVTRKLRVPPEPLFDGVTIVVQHGTLGRLSRYFDPNDMLISVYDWIGSLSQQPEHFSLCIPPGNRLLDPTLLITEVKDRVLFVQTEESDALLWPDSEVNFLGFGDGANDLDDTLSLSYGPWAEAVLVDDSGKEAQGQSCGTTSLTNREPTPLATASSTTTTNMYGNSQAPLSLPVTATVADTCQIAPAPLQSSAGPTADTHNPSQGQPPLSVGSSVTGNRYEAPERPSSPPTEDIRASPNKRTIRVKRVSIVKDMIMAFMDAGIVEAERLHVVMVRENGEEENGVDTGGLFRDALSAFWDEFFTACASGEDERIPLLRHDFQACEWEAVGRIIAVGFKKEAFYPFRLCKVFMASGLFGEAAVTSEMLIKSFLAYIASDERQLVTSVLGGCLCDEEADEWIDFLDRYSCKRIPSHSDSQSAKEVLVELAHKELIQEVQYILDNWSEAFKVLRQMPEFQSIEALNSLYEKVKPTTKRVLKLLNADPATNAQRSAVEYLERYIRGLNEENLRKFLRFCTGASVMCVQNIDVMFTVMDKGRRLVAHTCGPTLELPTTYKSFPEFRQEASNILSSNYWEMDFV